MFCRDAGLLHNRKEHLRATGSLPNPPGKLLQQVLFSVLWRNQLAVATAILRLTMNDDRMTVVPDFLGELDAGVFMNKIAAALNTVGLGVLNNGNKGKVVLTFDFERMGNSVEEKRVKIKHKLQYSTPTPRGKASEEDTTETPMWVNKGGKLTILQEDQGQLFSIKGTTDGKLKAAQ